MYTYTGDYLLCRNTWDYGEQAHMYIRGGATPSCVVSCWHVTIKTVKEPRVCP